ncbi:hypothetical protein AJ79_04690 [Helicocarpus griseus UAMH5409]|uniref:Uncharacterized protein n=1 Tax=Helicocarpus griseus UAMH5409 TaxID=1447875 RepID=A0A2B7XS51_9EURO|nr:hypothetical protein AJ79_04690 [Helicocarpus griseus UAMH5409]
MTDSGLTPIRVRGKRYKTPRAANKTVVQKGQAKTNKKTAAGLPSNKKRKLQDKCRLGDSKRVKPAGRKISPLESLPAELIEKIFLHSLELNFARSSPHFGAILSRKRVLKILTFLAFFYDPRPDDNGAASYISNILRHLEYVPLDLDAQKSLQNGVINCRWFNLPLLKECKSDMFKATLEKFVFGRSFCGVGMVLEPSEMENLTKTLNRDPSDWEMQFQGTDRHDVPCTLGISAQKMNVASEIFTTLGFSPLAVWTIPGSFFMRTLWTEEAMDLLLYLLNHAPYDVVYTGPNCLRPRTTIDISRDRVQDCIHDAIVGENPSNLWDLLSWDEKVQRIVHGHDRWGVPNGYGIRGEHFITAVHQTEDAGLFQVLLRAHAESMPYDDPEITAWAMRQRDREFGDWLLSYMIEVPARRRDHNPLFRGGFAADGHPDDPSCNTWWDRFEQYLIDRGTWNGRRLEWE